MHTKPTKHSCGWENWKQSPKAGKQAVSGEEDTLETRFYGHRAKARNQIFWWFIVKTYFLKNRRKVQSNKFWCLDDGKGLVVSGRKAEGSWGAVKGSGQSDYVCCYWEIMLRIYFQGDLAVTRDQQNQSPKMLRLCLLRDTLNWRCYSFLRHRMFGKKVHHLCIPVYKACTWADSCLRCVEIHQFTGWAGRR